MLTQPIAASMTEDNEVHLLSMEQSASTSPEPFYNRVLTEISTSVSNSLGSNILKMPLQKLNTEVAVFQFY